MCRASAKLQVNSKQTPRTALPCKNTRVLMGLMKNWGDERLFSLGGANRSGDEIALMFASETGKSSGATRPGPIRGHRAPERTVGQMNNY